WSFAPLLGLGRLGAGHEKHRGVSGTVSIGELAAPAAFRFSKFVSDAETLRLEASWHKHAKSVLAQSGRQLLEAARRRLDQVEFDESRWFDTFPSAATVAAAGGREEIVSLDAT